MLGAGAARRRGPLSGDAVSHRRQPGDGPRTVGSGGAADVAAGRPTSHIAAAFHKGIAAATVTVGARAAARRSLSTVALTGGVFQNARLSGLVESGLRACGYEVLVHRSVPPNDGGISIGQAAVAAARSAALGDGWHRGLPGRGEPTRWEMHPLPAGGSRRKLDG